MEVCWQIQTPTSLRPGFQQKGRLKINTFIGFLPRPISSLASLESQYNSNGFLHQITASADFSRKKQGRMSASGPKSSAPRGFGRRTTVGSAQKRTQKKNVEKDSNATSTVTNEGLGVSNLPEAKADVQKQALAEDDVLLEQKLKVERESLRRKEIEALAEEALARGDRMFVYPLVAKPDEDIEVFLNKTLSTLSNEPDVLIMGAFNDWRWKSFTRRLEKTEELHGDWLSCLLHIPKEAYKMDFVFFNGQSVYDNNDSKDFCVDVKGGMDKVEFENFLLEEKWREQEKLAKEEAERERQEEEKRRIEARKAAIEADREQAKVETQKRREMLQPALQKAVVSSENVWYIEPKDFKGGDKVKIYYNKSYGPLAYAKEVWIHGGFNNWIDGLSIVEKLKADSKSEDWWFAEVIVPVGALVIDWVFADGPPKEAFLYDNNSLQDFHALVPLRTPEELYWSEEESLIFRKLQEERRLKEEAMRVKMEKTALLKAETKERTLKKFLLSQKDVVYTEPLEIQAGRPVTVFYNPSNTVLNGKPEVWFRGSFNRWTHRLGPLPPQKMEAADDGSSHVKTSAKVPLDAYMMDFVFSEKEDGGVFDNRYGLDYHLPVVGGIAKEPPLHIVHIAVEMAPIAKVGGLGDVVTSLSRAVQELNHNVDIIFPKYDCIKYNLVKDLQFNRSYHWGDTEIKVWHGKVEGVSVYFLDPQNGLFQRGCVYGCADDAGRFGFFCHAALEFLLQGGFHPDILHCHDWSSAPVSWLFKDHYTHYGLIKTRVVFTIHNLEFGASAIGKAMTFSDKATTVSRTYAKEVAGNSVISPHLYKFHGIVNGIDPDIWDPFNDNFIPVPYTSENVVEGKRAAKEELQNRLGLKSADLPLVGIITRLTHQKGIHLIKHAIWRTLERNGQVVLLGSAPDPRIQNDFVNLANQLHSTHGDRARLVLTYDEPLSHLIYAGADFILVPSIFEPCGLTQLIAMRYGAVPVVRKTGGLYDTVFDVDHDKERAQAQVLEPNGFSFDGADAPKNCRKTREVPCRPGLGGAIVPRSCDHVPQPGEEPCPLDPWMVVPDRSQYVDQQTLKLQENPEDVPTGELPRNMLLSVDRHLVQLIVPGTRLTVMGIYSIFQASSSSNSHKGAVAIRQPYIRVVGLEDTNEASSRGPANFTPDEEEEFKKFAASQDVYSNICTKIAPSIFGHEDVKKAVACLLFGGSRKSLPDGVKLRGDINVLLLGDPSTAKSQFLKFVEKTAPIAVYTSGKGSSAAGLTASVIRDSSTREFYLEGGAMVLADGGVVCIDEFDKMRPEDRVAIHEAMEQQTISIAKAGITTVLNSRTSVLAAANPPSGRYDDLKTAQDNIDLQTTILSRFDLIFIVKDIRKYSQDKEIASHIIRVHASADKVTDENTDSKEDNWLKRYIQYCRSRCHPRLTEAAAMKLQQQYVKIREDMKRRAHETGEAAPIPITVRQLEAIVRLSESLAKMRLSHDATEDDVGKAFKLFDTSTMDAARSGINQQINITSEMANEIKQAETQIKRRMGIGARLSERRLIEDLARMGMNDSMVRRALLIMHQRGEVEYQRERRSIVRKA